MTPHTCEMTNSLSVSPSGSRYRTAAKYYFYTVSYASLSLRVKFVAPHVDSLKFSGGIVAGLSLLSTRLLRLAPDHSDDNFKTTGALSDPSRETTPYYNLSSANDAPEEQADLLWKHDTFAGPNHIFDGSIEVLLPRRSIYILAGPLRYSFTHEILGTNGVPKFIFEKFTSDRRLSLILRDELHQGS